MLGKRKAACGDTRRVQARRASSTGTSSVARWTSRRTAAKPPEMNPTTILPLVEAREHVPAAASLIHHEFWQGVPGASVERMQARLGRATRTDALPMSWVALRGEQLVGVVNLVENDDEDHPEWFPWLAGMVVVDACRGQGIGSALVRTLRDHALAMGFERVYFGTDGPGFYTRLGAVHHEQPRAGFWFMRFDLRESLSLRLERPG